MKKNRYKVLWIDDDKSLHKGYCQLADFRQIELVPFTSWKAAETEFKANFQEWTAIVLDAYCKLDEKSLPNSNFLNEVVNQISICFAQNQREIPWYVLSAGTMNNFDFLIQTINLSNRIEHCQDWGELVYIKDDFQTAGEDNTLFDSICRVGDEMSNNVVLYRHQDVFKYFGKDAIFSPEARRILLKALSVIYFPEENVGYEFKGNPLRKVLEYIFRGAIKAGILPKECLNEHDNLNLNDCCLFFSGKEMTCENGKLAINLIMPRNKILSDDDSSLIKNIKNYSSSDSHTNKDDNYVIGEDKKELFFGYLMQLCYIVKVVGSKIEENPNSKINKSNIIKTPKTSVNIKSSKNLKFSEESKMKYEGFEAIVEQDNNGYYHCGDCILNYSANPPLGKTVRLSNIIENSRSSNITYPYFAKNFDLC